MRKKRGSLLIESVVGILVLSVVSLLSFTITLSIIRSIDSRKETMDRNESLYAVCNEVKYNLTSKEIEDVMTDNEARVPYKTGFLAEIKTVNLFNIKEDGRKIGEFRIRFSERKAELDKITITLLIENEEVLEQSFIKAPWMCEV